MEDSMNNPPETESATTNGVQIRQSRRLPDFLQSVNLLVQANPLAFHLSMVAGRGLVS